MTILLRPAAEAHIDAMPDDAQAIMRGPAPGASRFVGSAVDEDPITRKRSALPYKRTEDGVAVITITGSLINRGAWVGSSSGETSYEGIQHQVATAAADPRTKAILLDIESPGGEAVGAFETAAVIRAAAERKPVVALANGMMASAAYALGSGATRLVATPTGLAGSIGVVMLHADYSRRLEKKGVAPTLIFAGAHKVDGNPFEPLSAGVRDDLQREVNQYYDLFVQTVAAGRKRMSPAMIRATEARTYMGHDARDAGLADDVGTFEDVLADVSRRGPAGRTTTAPTQGKSAMDDSNVTNAQLAAAKAEGAAAEAERFRAIMASDKVKGREAAALQLAAAAPAMTADQVIALVAGLPAAAAAAPPKGQRGERIDALARAFGQPPADAAKPSRARVVARINARHGFSK